MVIHDREAAASEQAPTNIGGKARGLVKLMRAGAQVPPWFVLTPGADPFTAVAAWREAGWPEWRYARVRLRGWKAPQLRRHVREHPRCDGCR